MPTILDFNIKADHQKGYSLQVTERGKPEPLAESSFSYDVSFLKEFEIRQLDADPKDPQGRLERLRKFGANLFNTVFTKDILTVWQAYKKKQDFLILCVRIDPDADELEIVPWETLYDGEEFISAGVKTGMARLPLDIPPEDTLPAVPLPIKMLAFISSPLDLREGERLQIEREQEILLQATNAPSGQGKLHVEFEDEAKLTILENSLEAGDNIFHYSGHGISPENGSGLLFEDADGKKKPVPVHELLQSFGKGAGSLRLAVLSGCQTAKTLNIAGFRDLTRGLLHQKVPGVLAMQFSISDSAGLSLAENLYSRIPEGKTLEMVLSACRRAML
ncbi:MAG: CHAT domain-containing protein, partial [Bacteroidota bacterium]